MRKVWIISILVLLITLVSGTIVLAQADESGGRDPEFEQAIYDRLAAIDREAVPLFRRATDDLDAGNLTAAKASFEQVLDLTPDFSDALRRLSYIETELENHDSAMQLARRAYEVDDSPYNQAALAATMLWSGDAQFAAESLQLASAAANELPDDDYAHSILLFAGVVNEDFVVVRQASKALVRIVPESPTGHFWNGLTLADSGEWEQAEAELLLAQQLGFPAEEVQRILVDGVSREASIQRLIRTGITVVAAWVVGLAVLFALGLVLSHLTLQAVQTTQLDATFSIGSGERLVRRIYRIVIGLTSAFYYVSLPLLALLVVGVVAGMFYAFQAAGRIPLRLAAFSLIVGLVTLYAIARSVFVRVRQEEPGDLLARQDAPLLWQLAEDVAERVTTRPIDAIYIIPGSGIGVTEHGSILKKLRGEGRRYLLLGLGVLPGMTQGQFKAILAHEYGHFSNRDTAGGNLALQVQVSMLEMARSLAMNGQARWYNPVWIFLNVFNRIFLRITLGASRLQEILADRYAVMAYGTQNFIAGLTHVVRQGLVFEMQVNDEIKNALEEKRSISNLYVLPALEAEARDKQEAAFEEVMKRPTSAYDSHPAMQDRIRLVQQLGTPEVEADADPVWILLPGFTALQEDMTRTIYDNVMKQQRLISQMQRSR